MALRWFTGWEHQTASTAGGGIYNGVSLTPTPSTAQFANGAASVRIREDDYFRVDLTANAIAVCHFRLRIAAAPSSGEIDIARFQDVASATDFAIGLQSTRQLRANWGFGNGVGTSSALNLDQWYRVEFYVDATINPWAVGWRIDGVAQTASPQPATGATTFDKFFSGMIGSVTSTADIYLDDMVVYTGTVGDYPPGDLKVLSYSPNINGVHNLDASPSSFFFQHDGASPAALTTAESTSWTRVDDADISGSTDYLYVSGAPGSGQYAELQFSDESGNYTVHAVRVLEAVLQGTAGGSVYTSKVSDDNWTSSTDVQTALDVSSATEVFRARLLLTKPSGGSWTTSAISSMKYRFGFTTDATPEIQLRAVKAEALLTAGAGATYYQLLGIG